MSKRIQVMLDDETHDELEVEAKRRAGISIGTMARWVLGGWADKQRKDREAAKNDGSVYGP